MGKGFSSPSNNVVGDVQPFPSSSNAAVPAFNDDVFDDDSISGDLLIEKSGRNLEFGRNAEGESAANQMDEASAMANRRSRLQRNDSLLVRVKRQRQKQMMLEEERKINGRVASRQHSEHGTITAISGAASGVLCALCVAPLDVVKARLQASTPGNAPKFKGTFHSLSQIFKTEGLRGLYRGLPPTLLGYVPSWSMYFTCYGWLQHQLVTEKGWDKHPSTIISAVCAGAVSNIVTNPFWVVRTRLQTQEHVLQKPEYRNTWHAVRKIYTTEGVAAFYKGLAASFLGLSHVAIQFPLYEWLKADLRSSYNDMRTQASERNGDQLYDDDGGGNEHRTQPGADIPILIVASALSKIAATMLTYPHEVLRTRMHVQKHGAHVSLVETYKILIKEGGVLALYRGLGTNLIRVTPACAVTFTSYETFVHLLYSYVPDISVSSEYK